LKAELESRPPNYYHVEYWRRWARVYDRLTWLLLLPFGGEKHFRQRLLDFAGIKNGERVLEMCAGTGSLTQLLARKVGSGRVTAIDLSPDMLAHARKKTAGLPVDIQQASCDALPFGAGRFDKVFISYGLHELPPPIRQKALAEAYRMVRSGGAFFALDYHSPRSGLWRFAIGSFVRRFEGQNAYSIMPDRQLSGELERAGFKITGRVLPLFGMFQMLRAEKAA
jgi:ubiquinone/menaquinone biosynthesis C-methylase UbiE